MFANHIVRLTYSAVGKDWDPRYVRTATEREFIVPRNVSEIIEIRNDAQGHITSTSSSSNDCV